MERMNEREETIDFRSQLDQVMGWAFVLVLISLVVSLAIQVVDALNRSKSDPD